LALDLQLVLLASGREIVLPKGRFVTQEIGFPAAWARHQQDLVLRHVVHHPLQGGDALGHQQLPAVLGAAGEVQRVAILLHRLGGRSIAGCWGKMSVQWVLIFDAIIGWNSISAPAWMLCGVKLNKATKQHTRMRARDMVDAQCKNHISFLGDENIFSYLIERSIRSCAMGQLLSLNISFRSQQNLLIPSTIVWQNIKITISCNLLQGM
jgi:hypothetical protein